MEEVEYYLKKELQRRKSQLDHYKISQKEGQKEKKSKRQ